MDRTRSPRLVITFPTTTAAMMMDSACDPRLGRLIPVPREISAGCGLAWCAMPGQREALCQIMEEHNLSYEEIRIIDMY